MYHVIMKPEAIKMAKEAYEWYNEQQLGLGDNFLLELRSCGLNLNPGLIFMQRSKRIIGN